MNLEVGKKAPDFTIEDWQGNSFTLSEHFGSENVFLIFNRGFV